MANFKRRKPRTRTRGRSGRTHFFNHWPAWWDIMFHRRPERRRAAAVTAKVRRGEIDADQAAWPVGKKPHQYYW